MSLASMDGYVAAERCGMTTRHKLKTAGIVLLIAGGACVLLGRVEIHPSSHDGCHTVLGDNPYPLDTIARVANVPLLGTGSHTVDLAAGPWRERNGLDFYRDRAGVAVCFAPGTPEDIVRRVSAQLFPDPGMSRFFLGGRWSGGQGNPRALTWSFVPDGLFIGAAFAEDDSGPSELFSRMDALFGSRSVWIGRFQQSFARWAELTGTSYTRITFGGTDWDDGAFWGAGGSSTRGDIRIAMRNVDGAFNVVAFNFFPSNGDMVLDRSETWASSSRFLRNVIMHEHGHGLGMFHVCSSDSAQLMEPFLSTSFDGPQHDDLRGAQRHYGDPFEPDNSAATATNLGTPPVGSTVSVGTIPTPAIPTSALLSMDATGEQDWFRFTTTDARLTSVSVIPRGTTYDSSPQVGGDCTCCNPVASLAMADLNFEIIDTDAVTVLATADSQPAGSTEILTDVFLSTPGDYYVRVFVTGSTPEPQLYNLQLVVNATQACGMDADCDDAVFCNGSEMCQSSLCQPGLPPSCDDAVGCTVDSCNTSTDSCEHVPSNALCDNGQFCDGAETCDPALDCQAGTPVDCGDGVSCTVDSCNETNDSCANVPSDALCDNGQFCDGAETCDPLSDCQPGTPVDCDDGVSCTDDSCNETNDSCANIPGDALCDNGQFCDGVETCDPLLDCQPGTPVDCDDGVSCTVDSCDEDNTECLHAADDSPCDDGQFCNGLETCDAVDDCKAAAPVDCSDGVSCTLDSCDEDSDECVHLADDVLCDDGLFCNGAETCDPLEDCQAGGDPCPGETCDEESDTCVPTEPPRVPNDPVHAASKNRILSIMANNADTPIVIRVELLDLACSATGKKCMTDEDCRVCVGGASDSGPCDVDSDCPGGTCRVSGESCVEQGRARRLLGWLTPPFEPVGDRVPPGTLTATVEGEMPAFFTWPDEVVHVADCVIAPNQSYAISASTDGVGYSEPLIIGTIKKPEGKFWADVVGEFDGAEWTAPNGLVNVNDILAWINFVTFKPAPHITWLDLDPQTSNWIINVTDLQMILLAFRGAPYPPPNFIENPTDDPANCP